MQVSHSFEDGGQKGIRIERLERDAMRSTDIASLVSEIIHGRGIDGENGQERIFGAEFVDIVKPLEVPGVNVESDGMPAPAGENQKQLIDGLRAMEFDAMTGGGRERLRELGPGEIFAQKQQMKR